MASAFEQMFALMKPDTRPRLLAPGGYRLMIAEVLPVLTRANSRAVKTEFLVLESTSELIQVGARVAWAWSLESEGGAARCKEFTMAAWRSAGYSTTHWSDQHEQIVEFLKSDNWLGVQVTAEISRVPGTTIDGTRGSAVTRASWGGDRRVTGVTRALLDPIADPDGAFTSAERLALELDGPAAEYWMQRAAEYRALCGA